MNAMIFAAGLGSRLRPLTNEKPKALIEVAGYPLLELALKKLEHAGIKKVVINIHHHRDQMLNFLAQYPASNMKIIVSDEKNELLDTGGGLLHARSLFDAHTPILLYNVDIVTTAPLDQFIQFHEDQQPLASLMVKNRPTTRHLLFDEDMCLAGWQNSSSGETIMARPVQNSFPMGFQGIHIVSPNIFDFIQDSGVFSITKSYLELAAHHHIMGYESKDDVWFDIGTPEKLRNTEEYIQNNPQVLKNIRE